MQRDGSLSGKCTWREVPDKLNSPPRAAVHQTVCDESNTDPGEANGEVIKDHHASASISQ